MFEWWEDLDWQYRFGFAILLLLANAGLLFLGGIFWPWGWAIGGIMLVLACFGGNS